MVEIVAMNTELLVSTRKGLFTLERVKPGQWSIRDAAFLGDRVSLALADPRKPVRRMATNLVLVMLGLNLAVGLFGGAVMGVDADIAWQAHLGGFAVGFLLARPPARRPERPA